MSEPAKQVRTPEPKSVDTLASMLGVVTSQIEAALHETDAPATTWWKRPTPWERRRKSWPGACSTSPNRPLGFSGSDGPARRPSRARGEAATAIQFHDRLVQCLTHVCASLTHLAEFTGPEMAEIA